MNPVNIILIASLTAKGPADAGIRIVKNSGKFSYFYLTSSYWPSFLHTLYEAYIQFRDTIYIPRETLQREILR